MRNQGSMHVPILPVFPILLIGRVVVKLAWAIAGIAASIRRAVACPNRASPAVPRPANELRLAPERTELATCDMPAIDTFAFGWAALLFWRDYRQPPSRFGARRSC